MSADALLSRLDKLRQRGPGQWSARCPAHEDKGPSLSVKELPDGRILLKCFAGCEAHEVVGALGMAMHDLFPPSGNASPPGRVRGLLPPRQALELIDHEANLVAVAALNAANGVTLTDADRARLVQAANRINYLLCEVRA
jgi:hypothetical protein